MKIERRGKYAGCKIHLEVEECNLLLKATKTPTPKLLDEVTTLSINIGKKIAKLQAEYPTLLKERTQAEIQHELEVELESAQKKIKALKLGGDWQSIHIK